MSPLKKVLAELYDDVEKYTTMGLTPLAWLAAEHAKKVEQACHAEREEILDLSGANLHSGYSKSHLRYLVREGVLENLGRKHAPRFRRSDLPIRSGYTPPLHEDDREDDDASGAAPSRPAGLSAGPLGGFDAAALAAGMI